MVSYPEIVSSVMFPKLIHFLNAPYPVNTSYQRVVGNTLGVGVFIAVFLVMFQPFGLSTTLGPYRLLAIASFSLPCMPIVFFIGMLSAWVFRRNDWEIYWKVKHEIILTLTIPLLIGGANFVHGHFIFDWPFSWVGLLMMQSYTVAISFFPITGIIAADWAKLVKKHQGLAAFVNQGSAPSTNGKQENPDFSIEQRSLLLEGENQQENLRIVLDELLFIKAEGNYVELVTFNHEQKLERFLLRAPLKVIESQLVTWENEILRCHRSYLVNCRKIKKAAGNAQGLSLCIESIDQRIPVSRKYVDVFRTRCRDR